MPYSVRSDIENIYGVSNIIKWADLDNDRDETAIENRITATGVIADNRIDSKLREGPYQIPFSSPYDGIITDISARLTGVLLYENRGVTDSDTENHDLIWHLNQVNKTIMNILSGVLRLDTSKVTVATRTPWAGEAD